MELPTQKTPKKMTLAEQSILLYGPPKIGKSTLCSQAEGAIFFRTEPGLNFLEVYQLEINSWEDFLEACNLIAKPGHAFKNVIVDTVDNAYKFCAEYICKQNGIKHPNDLQYGKGFALVNNEFHRVITKLAALPTGLVMVSHAMDKELDAPEGKYIKAMPTLPDGARKAIIGMVDVVMYATVEKRQTEDGKVTWDRVLKTKPNKYHEAGDRTGRLPEQIPLDYSAFLSAFSGGADKTPAVIQPQAAVAEKELVAAATDGQSELAIAEGAPESAAPAATQNAQSAPEGAEPAKPAKSKKVRLG